MPSLPLGRPGAYHAALRGVGHRPVVLKCTDIFTLPGEAQEANGSIFFLCTGESCIQTLTARKGLRYTRPRLARCLPQEIPGGAGNNDGCVGLSSLPCSPRAPPQQILPGTKPSLSPPCPGPRRDMRVKVSSRKDLICELR